MQIPKLKEWRERRGLTQKELAQVARVSPRSVAGYEAGQSIRPNTARKIADALEIAVEDLLNAAGEYELDEREKNRPKANALPSPKPERASEEKQRDIYMPWLEFINSYADRWEAKIADGAFDRGAADECISTIEDHSPILIRLGLQEREEQPSDYFPSFGPIIDEAVTRIDELLDSLIEAHHKQVKDSDLARLQRRREEIVSNQNRAANREGNEKRTG